MLADAKPTDAGTDVATGRFAHRPKAATVKLLPQVPYAVRHMRVSAEIGAELLTTAMRNVLGEY